MTVWLQTQRMLGNSVKVNSEVCVSGRVLTSHAQGSVPSTEGRGEGRPFQDDLPLPILHFEVVCTGCSHITEKGMITLMICVAMSPKPKTKRSCKDSLKVP